MVFPMKRGARPGGTKRRIETVNGVEPSEKDRQAEQVKITEYKERRAQTKGNWFKGAPGEKGPSPS